MPTPFKDIPQDEFDSFEKNLQKTNEERENKKFPLKDSEESIYKGDLSELKVKCIDIQNIRNISYINETFSDFVIIGGHNAQGKSSFIDSIFLAIQGSKFAETTNAKIIKHGEDKAEITLSLEGKETSITIWRTFKKGTAKNPAGNTSIEMSINGETGKKLSQKQLDSLINILTIDPLGIEKIISSKGIPESIRMIQVMTGIDLSQINGEIKSLEEEQKEANGYLKTMQGAVDSYGFSQKIEKVDINELLKISEEFQVADKLQVEVNQKLSDYNMKKLEIDDLEKRLEKARKELEEIKTIGGQKRTILIAKQTELSEKYGSYEDIKTKISEAQKNNENAVKYELYLKDKKNRDEAEKDVNKIKDSLEKKRKEKVELIKNSKLPPYMEIDETLGILVDGVEYRQLNTARKIEVGIDLVLLSNSPLRVLRIQEGGELDLDTISQIQDKVIEKGFQIFIERAKVDEFDTIILREGEVLNEEQKTESILSEKKKERDIKTKLSSKGQQK